MLSASRTRALITRAGRVVRHSSSPAYAVGDVRRDRIDSMVRVDHAGEFAAVRIYQGQLDAAKWWSDDVPSKTVLRRTMEDMKSQEVEHLCTIENVIRERRVRPSALLPLWNCAGYLLGFTTGLLGKEAAMACTVAVEEVIGGHYNDQLRELMVEGKYPEETELRDIIRRHRDDELEHIDIGVMHDAKQAPVHDLLTAVVKSGCHAAIWVSKRF